MKENPFTFIEEYQMKMEKYPLPEKAKEQYTIEKCRKDGTDTWTLLAKNSLTGIFASLSRPRERSVLFWNGNSYKTVAEGCPGNSKSLLLYKRREEDILFAGIRGRKIFI